ncbi:MAG: ABC transporter permease [Lachnospiraceae bacterium]|nr:ABC transporter permease [Lachnospiraceae bacterium]
MLFKLSLKNIRKSFRDYTVYFFTLVVGVAVFYVFNAIESQTVMMEVTANTREIIRLMTEALSSISVFVSFVLGFLIVYASQFLIKRRNKEFGIYLTLGMGKRKISMILFLETLLIGIVSLVAGLFVGAGLSQLMSAFVANMFEADMTEYKFIFSTDACLKTILYFSVMYIVVMVFNTINISRCRLIELLQAERRSEKQKLKNPWLCVLIFIAASAVLGYAYYMVTAGFGKLDTVDKIVPPICMGIVSTFLIFWSLSGLLLRIVMSLKGIYYRGLNSFTLRQISSKINTQVVSISIICLMLFVTICTLSACLSVRNTLTMQLDEMAAADVEMTKHVGITDIEKETMSESAMAVYGLSIKEIYEAVGIDLFSSLTDVVEGHIYMDAQLTFGATLGDLLESIQSQYTFLGYDTVEDIVALSEYNAAAAVFGNETFTLAEDEYLIVADFQSMVNIRNLTLQQGQELTVFGHLLKPKYAECKTGWLEMSGSHVNAGIIVVPDAVVQDGFCWKEFLLANYAADKKEEKREIEEQVQGIWHQNNWHNVSADGMVNITMADGSVQQFSVEDLNSSLPIIDTRIDISEAMVGMGGLMAFIGLYLGVIFLISSAALLALKELSESADNKERYHMLRKLGADESMLNRALFRQIGIFFLAPLLLAAVHSVFGILFSIHVLEVFGTVGLAKSIATTVLILAAIYGGYFLLTYFSSKNIIRGR